MKKVLRVLAMVLGGALLVRIVGWEYNLLDLAEIGIAFFFGMTVTELLREE